MTDGAIILDTPDKIRAFGLLQVYHMLKMEVDNPKGPTWRAKPHKTARHLLTDNGRPDPGRLKKNIFKAYEAWLREQAII